MANKSLPELRLRDEGITVLGVDSKRKEYFGSPIGIFTIEPEDVITIYGKAHVIKNIYKRQRDFSGEREHFDFVKKENIRKNDLDSETYKNER